jgi:hypothetical protein
LSDDQKAMLRLLAQREQGYDDIAALMGLSVEEVRARVKDALAELDREKAEVKGDAEPPPFREPAPEAPAPEPPKARAQRPKPARPRAAKIPRPGLPKDQGALRGLIAGAAVVLVIVLLLVTGVFGDGGGGSGSTTASGEAGSGESTTGTSGEGEEEGVPTIGGKVPTQAVLKPVNGGDASGQALFGRAGKNVLLLVAAKGLKPSAPGQSYALSLVRSPSERVPVVEAKVGNQGTLSGRINLMPQILGFLAGGFDEMELSLVPTSELKSARAQVTKTHATPQYGGEAVLTGKVTGPIVEAGGEG